MSVKREFASGRDNPSRQEAEDEEGSNQGQGNLLDCLMQVRIKLSLPIDNHISFSPFHTLHLFFHFLSHIN